MGIIRVCQCCRWREATTTTRAGDHLCERCNSTVNLGVALLLARDAFYMRLAFGEPLPGELTASGAWVVSGARALEGLNTVRARRDNAMWN